MLFHNIVKQRRSTIIRFSHTHTQTKQTNKTTEAETNCRSYCVNEKVRSVCVCVTHSTMDE